MYVQAFLHILYLVHELGEGWKKRIERTERKEKRKREI
jgi:hypothetical protein